MNVPNRRRFAFTPPLAMRRCDDEPAIRLGMLTPSSNTVREQETAIPIYDAIATAVWKSLTLAGVDPTLVNGWGSLFE